MRYSPEGLDAFVAAAALGSFSAAARQLRKSQSTVSAAIANLETDLGLVLFDRQSRKPQLTAEGQRVLLHVNEILAASERLDQLAIRLNGHLEPKLTFVLSDNYQPSDYHKLLADFEQRYPDIEYECLVAENEDVIDLIQSGRANLGLVAAQESYPVDISAARLPVEALLGLFVASDHPLAQQTQLTLPLLATYRELRLNSYTDKHKYPAKNLVWSTPDYLMLLSMAEQGFGWAQIPQGLVKQFSHQGQLSELTLPGYPKRVAIDVVWSNNQPPGPVGSWLRERLLAG